MTLKEAKRFVDTVHDAYARGEEPLRSEGAEREILLHGTSEERRRLIAERHFAWARWYEALPRAGDRTSGSTSLEQLF